ncbi:hypothetical protein LX36DRAFT_417923 [Colletotrichum falcatum]|nr:hypothetical protein LX36DRAFT_417923 [Colletotrichum falcatum]
MRAALMDNMARRLADRRRVERGIDVVPKTVPKQAGLGRPGNRTGFFFFLFAPVRSSCTCKMRRLLMGGGPCLTVIASLAEESPPHFLRTAKEDKAKPANESKVVRLRPGVP